VSTPVTNVQRLSMSRAAEGIKALRAHIAALDTLEEMVPALSGERLQSIEFRTAVTTQVKALNSSVNIFTTSGWRGAAEQEAKFRRAIGRVEHCATAIVFAERRRIIESALAEAKDLIEQCIAFLDFEAHRYPEKGASRPEPKSQPVSVKTETGPELKSQPVAEKTEAGRTKAPVSFWDAFSFKLPFGLGTVDPVKLREWFKERGR
jgi:hypothetical protein